MKRVLFCFYPLYVKYNHGIALLSALCKECGIDTRLEILSDLESFTAAIVNYDPDYVAFSAVVEQDYRELIKFALRAKALGQTTLLGGVYARRGLPVDTLFDHVCRGEGETLPDYIINGDKELFERPMFWPDLNALPLPDYELFGDVPFDRGVPFLKDKKVLPYYSSRGCRNHCSFCLVRQQTGKVRFRFKVKNDLKALAEKYGPDAFMIGDEQLPYFHPAWRESWGDFSYPFYAYIRADIKPTELDWLHERGLIGCAFGIESGDERHRNDVLKKGVTDAQIYATVERLNRLGIHYSPFYMMGTPGETFEIKNKTHGMAQMLGGYPIIFEYEELAKAR